jgi:hypothetical protein
MIVGTPGALQAFRIAPGDTNDFACLLDPIADGVGFTTILPDEDLAALQGRP